MLREHGDHVVAALGPQDRDVPSRDIRPTDRGAIRQVGVQTVMPVPLSARDVQLHKAPFAPALTLPTCQQQARRDHKTPWQAARLSSLFPNEASAQVGHKTREASGAMPEASMWVQVVSLVLAEQVLDAPVGDVLPSVEALRVPGQQDLNAVAGALGNLGRVGSCVEPRR